MEKIKEGKVFKYYQLLIYNVPETSDLSFSY